MTSPLFALDRIGAGLPVAAAQDELTDAIRTGEAVIVAPPGTGKTTLVPPLVANLMHEQAFGRTLVTQPRRVAVRAAAHRVAELQGSDVGAEVGFTVRGERQVSSSTVLEALTPGVLLRRLLNDPGLQGVGAVVLDEVHERSVDTDVLLALLTEVRMLREDLTLVVMSATLNTGAMRRVLPEASVVDIPSALHPLTTRYAPYAGARLDERGVTRGYLEHVARVAALEQVQAGCDALVFVPGVREVEQVSQLLAGQVAESVEVLPLHGGLTSRAQDRAVRGGSAGSHRIVVSTALAESSVTVPGVHLVLDSGLARQVRRDQARDMSGLVTVSASRASATQRAGRAARLGPGTCVRMFSETELAHMPAETPPEIFSADLTDAALTWAVWGTPRAEGLQLLDAPPAASVARAERTLHGLGLVDREGKATPLGAETATLPVGVREARALISGTRLLGDARTAAEVVATLASDARESSADATALLRELRRGTHPASRRWASEVKRLTRIAVPHAKEADAASTSNPVGVLVALARPDWIARRTGPHARTYLFASGTRAALPEGSPLIQHEWIAVREVQRSSSRMAEGTGAIIRLAAALDEAEALEAAAPLLDEGRVSRIEAGRVRVRQVRQLGRIQLSSTPVAALPEDTGAAFATHVREQGLDALSWSAAATSLRGRLALLHQELGEPWPAMDDAALVEQLDAWLMPDLAALASGASLSQVDVVAALRRLLPWPEATAFDDLAPAYLQVPSGSRIPIEYPFAADARPTVSVKLQEVFGLAESPRLVGGRVPVLFQLLSPARRPLAVTDDLASFWDGPYAEVRKEMRGRYSKHPWPEDPWSATATARTKRHL